MANNLSINSFGNGNLFGSSGSSAGMAGLASDFNSISSGAYRKVLNSYYGTNKTSGASVDGASMGSMVDKVIAQKQKSTASTNDLSTNSAFSQGIADIKSSVSKLQNESTYEDTEDGKSAQEKTVSAIKDFVDDYNNVVDAAKTSTSKKAISNVAQMVKDTKANKEALAEIGITVDHNGKISVDEKKLESADLSKVQKLFSSEDKGSYGSKVATDIKNASSYTITKTETKKSSGDSVDTRIDTKSSTASLKSDLQTLKSGKLFDKVKDKDGKESYDTDSIAKSVKSFVKNYNSTLDKAKNSRNSGVSANLSYMKSKTSNNADKLSEIGITVNKDGSLSLDEDKLKNADMSKVESTFKNYGSSISVNASLVDYYMTTQASAANSYNSYGAYNVAAAAGYAGTV